MLQAKRDLRGSPNQRELVQATLCYNGHGRSQLEAKDSVPVSSLTIPGLSREWKVIQVAQARKGIGVPQGIRFFFEVHLEDIRYANAQYWTGSGRGPRSESS